MKTAFLLSTGTFRGDFFTKKSIILSLSDVVGELLDLFRKSFGGVVSFCNYVSIETFRGKKIFPRKLKFFQIGRVWAKSSWSLPKSFRQGCQNCILCVTGKFLGKSYFWKKIFFLSSSDIEQEYFGILTRVFWHIVKTAFYVSIGTFTGKIIFWRKIFFFKIIFGRWSKFWRQLERGCHTFFHRVPTNILRKFFFWKKVFFNHFRTLSENFSAFCQKFTAVLSNLYFNCPDDFFRVLKKC